jgi:hypothetical protein
LNKVKVRKSIQKLLDKAKKAEIAGDHKEALQLLEDAHQLSLWIKDRG